ncbi:hypothetical protein [Nonomuraea typhae]|uniref:Methyltransferase domain-containing protein n=1 Tax=Nonomuraea typhae TaxID=2603600 RepID=A0ABW7YLX1_9ACTN
MRLRLRPAHTPERLAEIYAQPHDHTRWIDHHLRVGVTIEFCRWFTACGVQTVADLSCGNAAIANALDVEERLLGDLAPGYQWTGPIEDTIHQIRNVDLFVLSETLEHLDNPDAVLKEIRAKTRYLVLSTPEGETGKANIEHYWGWDSAEVESMLIVAGFRPEIHTVLELREYGYDFQIWGCR